MMAPPLMEATYCYYCAPGRFTAIIGASTYTPEQQEFADFRWDSGARLDFEEKPVDHDLNWDEVKWMTVTSLYLFPDDEAAAIGPAISWRFAISEDGTPLDVHWVNGAPHMHPRKWDNAMVVVAKAITWMNCRNIELVEPTRPRPEQRRMARYSDVKVKELHIHPVGKTYRYDSNTKVGGGVPLHSVRGHLARYGIDGRKKLFGRITGTFWIPAHARGSAVYGEHETTRTLDA